MTYIGHIISCRALDYNLAAFAVYCAAYDE